MLADYPAPRRVTVAAIVEAVAQRCRVSADMLTTPDGTSWSSTNDYPRRREIARPRQIAMFLARELTGMSLPGLGLHFGGRDHTTVLYGVRAVEQRLTTDAETRRIVESLRARFAS